MGPVAGLRKWSAAAAWATFDSAHTRRRTARRSSSSIERFGIELFVDGGSAQAQTTGEFGSPTAPKLVALPECHCRRG